MRIPLFTAPPRAGWRARLGAVLLMLLVGLGGVRPGFGQAITQAEYFLDTDPGYGLATAMPVGTPAADLSLSATVDLTSLAAGFHRLGVRSKDAGNAWSLTSRRTFYYEPGALAAVPNITKVEYFIDAQAAVDVPVTAAADISGLAFAVDLSGTTAGFHRLSVRARDANGTWSLVSGRSFYYEPNATAAAGNITKVEYFIDATAAVDVPLTAAADISGLAFTVDLSGLSSGFHRLSVRSQDANGKWSLVNGRTFYYEPSAVVAAPNVTKVEYFLDANAAVDVPVTGATNISGLAFSVDLSSVTPGFHTLQVRSQDADGKWSLVSTRSFYYEPVAAAAPNITRIEYYFDTDPGFGSATDVPVTPAPTISGFAFVADASALVDGPHSLFVRSRDANGKWSLVWKRDFVKNGCASSPNFTDGLATTSYSQGGSYGGSAQQAFTTNPATLSTGNTFYGYNGSYLQADLGASQTLSEVRFRLQASGTSSFTLLLQGAPSTAGPFTTFDTYAASIGTSPVAITRTLATPVAARVLRLVVQNTAGQYLLIGGAGAYYFNCAGPAIVSFTPTGGAGGTAVEITGTNLTGATALTFNGVAAQSFTVNSATSITAVAPTAGSTGQLCVTTPSGSACSSTNYVYPPTIATGTVSPASFCSTTFISVPFTTNTTAYNGGNQFKFQLSDASGNFTAGSRLYGASASVNASGGTISDSIAFRTPAGSGYRVRVVSTNPSIIGTDNGVNLTVRGVPAATAAANSPVIYNGTIQLTAGPTGQSTYQWYVRYYTGGISYVGNGQTLNLTNAQPAQSGKYFVYVSNSGGCQDSASVGVTVQPNAVPVLAMGQFGFTGCAGTTFNIGFNVSGNSFLAGNAITAQLSDTGGSFAAATTIGSVNFTGQGSGSVLATLPTNTPTGTGYRIRLVGSNPAIISQNDNGQNLSITTQPVASAGSSSPVAYGGSIQLTAQTVAGASYQWLGPNFASTQQNPTISNATQANAGTYSLYVTVNGCQSPVATTTVTVSPSARPIITVAQFSGSLCPGTLLNVGFTVAGNTFASGNAIEAQLSDAGGSFAAPTTVGSVVFTGQGNGAVTVTIPQSQPAGTGYRLRLVGTNPAVVSQNDNGANLTVPTTLVATATGNSPVPFNGTIQLSAGPAGATSYQWYVMYTGGGTAYLGNSATLNLANAQPSHSGFYYVYVSQGGCQDSASVRIRVNPAATTTLALTTFGGSYCAGSSFSLGYTIQGADLNSGNTLTAQLSDANGAFSSPTTIGVILRSTAGAGSFTATLPTSLPVQGTGYRVRLVSSSPVLLSNDNGSNLTVSNVANATAGSNSPVAAGGTIALTATAISGATYAWTGPNGFNSSQANPTLSNASAANQGKYVVTISLGGCALSYSTDVTVTTPTVASISTSSISGSYCPGAGINVGFTASGLSGSNVFTAQLSDAGGSFASPVTLGMLSGPNSGTIAGTIPAGTASGSGYRVRVVGSSPATIGSDNGANLTISAAGSFTWLGGSSTNWFDPLNWSCGAVPTSTSSVTIGAGALYYPVIVGGGAVVNNITVATGANFTVSSSFTIYGNVTNFGLWNPGGAYVFAGSGTQTIGGSSAVYFGSVTVNNFATLSLSNNIYVSGNWLNYGTFLGGTYTTYWNGTSAQTIGGPGSSTFYNFVNQNAAGLTLNQLIYVGGNWTGNGPFSANGYGTVFNGTVAQFISGSVVTNFYDLTITNTVGVTLNTGIGIGGTFVNNGGFTVGLYDVVLNGTVAQVIGGSQQTTFYNLTINNTVGVTLSSNIYVLGNWLNNGLLVPGLYTVYFTGTGAQLIGGTAETTFYGLVLSNAVSVTLQQNIYVRGGFANTGVFYGYSSTGSVTTGYFVRFGGPAAQVINVNGTTYFWHFYADNAAGVSLASNIYVAGNFYLFSGSFAPNAYTVYFNGTGGLIQTVGGYTSLSFYGWNIGSNSFVRLLQNVTLTGDFTNLGTFYGYDLVGTVYTGYTFIFGGAAAQLIGGGGRYDFWHVTWNNTVSVTLNTNIHVLGNWLNNGGFVANAYTVFFDGPAAQLIGGLVNTTFHHVSILNLVSVTLQQPIVVLGNWGGTGVFLADTYLVSFTGTAAQTILTGSGTRFYHVRFNNATSVTLLSDFLLTGNWVNDAGFVAGIYGVYFSGTSLQTIGGLALTRFHHLFIGNGANVRLDRAIAVLGNWTADGAFLANSFAVTFSGTGAQIIGGAVSTIFAGIVFNNTGTVTLAQNIRVRGSWTNNGATSGSFVPATYTVFFDGAVAQLIGGSVSTTFHHLSILNLVGVTLGNPVFIGGNLTNDGLFTVAGFLVTFNGTALQTIGGSIVTIFQGVTFDNAVGVALGQHIRVRGDFRNLALFTAGGYVVYFDGSVAQGIYCPTGTLTFHDVTFANPAGVTLYHNVFLTGHWLNNGGFIANGQRVTFSGTTLQTIGGTVATVFHHLTIAQLANVRLDRAITLLGNWLNNGGTFAANSFAVFFNGTALQSIGGTALTQFYHLTLNNLVGVNLDYDIDLTGNFVNNGVFCGCGHRTRFNGLAPQTITCSSGNTRFHDLTFANATGVTLLDNIGVTGNWVNDGGFVANGYLVLFSGTALQTIGGTVLSAFHGMQLTNAVNVQLLRDITVAGSWTNSGIFSGNGFGVTFLGTVAQLLTNTGTASFHHVTITNPVSLTLAGNIIVLGNWLCNGVFDPATYTCLFNGTAGQTIGGSAQVRFYGLTINNTVGVTLNQNLYLLGNFLNNGLLSCGTSGWYCTGPAAQTLGGSSATRFYDLFIQNAAGVSCLSNLGVNRLLTLTTGNLASDGHLTLHSDATGTAMVVNPVGGGLVTGRSTMERFITGVAAPGYRHYSSPMQLGTATVQEFADDLPVFELNPAYNTQGNTVTPFPTFYQYDESRLNSTATNLFTRGWMTPLASDNLLPGRGYSAQTDPTTTVDISGTLANGAVSFPLTRGGQTGSGWNLVGNPYPAPIDWDLVPAAAGVDKALYVFVPSGKYTGTYSSYVAGIGQNGGTKDLAAMQGFFVRATSAAATLSLSNAARHTTYVSPDFHRGSNGHPAAAARPIIRLHLRNAAGQGDETVVYFDPSAGAGFQPDHDAYKVQLNGNGVPSLWSIAGTDGLSINGLPSLATAGSIPLGVRVSQTGTHTLNASELLHLPAGTQVTLEDRVLGRRQNLAVDSAYTFQMEAGYTGQRFYLWFQGRPTAVAGSPLEAPASLYPNPTTSTATLELSGLREQGLVKIDVLNTLGQPVLMLSARPRQGVISQRLDVSSLPVGVYSVRVRTAEGTVVKRLVRE